MARRLASISVDLDSLHHYCRIHGLPESLIDERARRLVYEVAVPRYLELFSAAGVKATFFAIGEDLAADEAGRALAEAHRRGVEIGNHSHTHDYALALRPEDRIAEEIRLGEEAIEKAVGERPVGFRAPGYTLSAKLLNAVASRGYRYDSSTFPAAPYYALKAMVMGALAVLGRRSKAVLDRPRVLLAPRRPYRPSADEPYARGDLPLVELPMAVTPLLRFPFIGTFAVTLPRAAAKAAYRSMRREPFFNFELHAVDVLDARDGVPEPLCQRQRDLRISHEAKLERLRELFGWLTDDWDVVTLREAAAEVAVA